VAPTAADTAAKAATLSVPHGLRATGGCWDDGSPEVDEASEAAVAAADVEEEETAAAAGEAAQKESAEILGRRRDLATRDMARLARGVRDAGSRG
jgi:hypothetical protein